MAFLTFGNVRLHGRTFSHAWRAWFFLNSCIFLQRSGGSLCTAVVSEKCTKAPDILCCRQTARPESLIKNMCGIYEPLVSWKQSIYIFPWNTVKYVSINHGGIGAVLFVLVRGRSSRRAQNQPYISPENKQLEKPLLLNVKGLVFHCHALQNNFVVPTQFHSGMPVPVITYCCTARR